MSLDNTGHVQDNSPSHSAMIARFYVLPQLTGSGDADIFVAYSNEAPSGVLFDISFDGTNFNFDAGGAGGASASAAAVTGWNLIEVKFNSGGNFEYWVNVDATTDPATGSFSSGSGTIEAVRMGLPNGLGGFSGGKVSYDSYESHASTPVGSLLIGDANADETVNVLDYSSVQQDILGNLQSGQPDCNLDGSVNVLDYGCVQSVILGG
ncbi:dockerin type I domain-containing protein [Elongatibacter sediminis]|uniref:Dockerin type I domain-containing protein n=1 Tax=Elongatibacter sediminis TaxID=3119006 RepID=A0AAW9RGD4_9GAMM